MYLCEHTVSGRKSGPNNHSCLYSKLNIM